MNGRGLPGVRVPTAGRGYLEGVRMSWRVLEGPPDPRRALRVLEGLRASVDPLRVRVGQARRGSS